MAARGDRHEITVRVTGAGAQDLASLHRWLSREQWFEDAEAAYGLTVDYRELPASEEGPGSGEPSMGGIVEALLLVLVGEALKPIVADLYRRVGTAVRAWQANADTGDHQVEVAVTMNPAPETDAPTGTDDVSDARPDSGAEEPGEGGGTR
jgi:hypothetical protein